MALTAQVRAAGGIPRILDVAADTVAALTARIHEGVATADLLVTSAGVSRGDFDVVKEGDDPIPSLTVRVCDSLMPIVSARLVISPASGACATTVGATELVAEAPSPGRRS